MSARRVQYDGGGPLGSRRYVGWVMSGRVEEYGGERGSPSLARSSSSSVCVGSDWRGPRVKGMRRSTNCRTWRREMAASAGSNSSSNEEQKSTQASRRKDVR